MSKTNTAELATQADTVPDESAKAALAAAVAQFESHFSEIGPDGYSRLAPDGEPYFILDSDGVQDEAAFHLKPYDAERARRPEGFTHYATPQAAVDAWITAFGQFVPQRGRWVLYWRTRPVIERFRFGRSPGWNVYSRLRTAKMEA